jgi:hypothetical protein
MKRFVGLVLLWTLAGALAIAADVQAKKTEGVAVRLTVEGKDVDVVVPKMYAIVDGRVVWPPEDIPAIVQALRDAEVPEESFAAVLSGNRNGSTATVCFRWDREDGTTISLDLPGDRIEADAEGRIAWTEKQSGKILGVLADEGRGVDLVSFFRLKMGTRPESETAAAGADPKPVNPSCGECLSGFTCTIKGKSECCSTTSGSVCVHCRTCAPKVSPSVEGVGVAE